MFPNAVFNYTEQYTEYRYYINDMIIKCSFPFPRIALLHAPSAQVRQEVEEMMAWSKAIARPVLRVAQDLRAASHEARHGLRSSSGTCYSSGYCSWEEVLRKIYDL